MSGGDNKKIISRLVILGIVVFSVLFFVYQPKIVLAEPDLTNKEVRQAIDLSNKYTKVEQQLSTMEQCFPNGQETKSSNCPSTFPYETRTEAAESLNKQVDIVQREVDNFTASSNNADLYADINNYQNSVINLEKAEEKFRQCFPNGAKERSPDCPDNTLEREGALSQIQGLRDGVTQKEQTISDKYGKSALQAAWEGAKEGLKSLLDPLSLIRLGIEKVASFLANLAIKFVGVLLWLTGTILDLTVNTMVLGMSGPMSSTAVKEAWVKIRDIINMLFIFGLLYISIQTIISGISPKVKSLLVGIITAALLINFSYFFTTVLIDASNYLTASIHSQMGGCASGGISSCFMEKIKIQTTLDPTTAGFAKAIDKATDGAANNKLAGSDGSWMTIVKIIIAATFAVIFIIILSFVFLSLAILLIIRFVVLIFLLVTSPVMFLGLVLPYFSSLAKSWLNKLTDNLLFAPVAFLFLGLSLEMADQASNVVGTDSFGISIIINYILIISFTIGSILAAKQLGAAGAGFATSVAGVATTGLAVRGAARAGSWAGRQTIGRGAAALANKIPASSQSRILQGTKKYLGNVGSKSTFDFRNTQSFGNVAKATGLVGGATFAGAGKGYKMGYTDTIEKRQKDRDSQYEAAGQLTNEQEREKFELQQSILREDDTPDAKGHVGYGKKLKQRKDLSEQVERDRDDLRDLNNQLSTLDKDSEEYTKIKQRAQEVANNIQKSKDDIAKIDTEIQESPQAKRIVEIEKSAKDNQENWLKEFSANKAYNVSGNEKTSKLRKAWYRITNDSASREADTQSFINIKKKAIKAKDGGEGEVEKIIKSAGKENAKRQKQRDATKQELLSGAEEVNYDDQIDDGGVAI